MDVTGRSLGRTSLLLMAVLLLAGCASMRHHEDVGFEAISSLDALNGTYANLAEAGDSARPVYLSTIIWPRDESLHHASADAIEIEARDDVTLAVRAVTGTGTSRQVLKESEFVQGEDFDFKSGRLHLKAGPRLAGTEIGEPVLGLQTMSIEVGLDERGDGKLRGSTSVIGLAYMIVPVAAGETHEMRFVRLDRPRPGMSR